MDQHNQTTIKIERLTKGQTTNFNRTLFSRLCYIKYYLVSEYSVEIKNCQETVSEASTEGCTPLRRCAPSQRSLIQTKCYTFDPLNYIKRNHLEEKYILSSAKIFDMIKVGVIPRRSPTLSLHPWLRWVVHWLKARYPGC